MIIDFEDKELESLIYTGKSRKYKKYIKDKRFMTSLLSVFARLETTDCTDDLFAFSPLHFERLQHTNGLCSVRIINGRVERLIFREYDEGIKILLLELNTTHYGNKK